MRIERHASAETIEVRVYSFEGSNADACFSLVKTRATSQIVFSHDQVAVPLHEPGAFQELIDGRE